MTVAAALVQVELHTPSVTRSSRRTCGALGGRVRASTRRVSAGIHPAPGATSRLPAWWGAEDWLSEVDVALLEHRDVCRSHRIQPDTVLAVARGMAGYADRRTGRDCRPTNVRLVDGVQVSLSTVQRARRVLKALGLVVELVAGRSILTRSERLEAWQRGSAHRQIAAEFALCSRRQRPRRPGRVSPGRRVLVERDTPPRSYEVRAESHLSKTHLRSKTDKIEEERAPHAAPTKAGRRRTRHDPAARRLAEGVRGRMAWLRGVSAARLAPLLTPHARAGWTPRDVERAAAGSLAARGWRLHPNLAQPAAYLATLLREVDPLDRPGALDEQQAREEAAQRAYERQLVFGSPCAHGQPAGDVPSPRHGRLACPACRANVTPDVTPVAWPDVRLPGTAGARGVSDGVNPASRP